jgi:hypothetical protein
VVWELPFGKGKPMASAAHGIVNQVIGGWQVQSMAQNQTGPAVVFGNVLFRGDVIRCEAEGVANHPNFAAPNAAPTNILFGQVSTPQTQQEERRISLGLKLMF